jgi:hypothetical protein
VSSIAVRGTRRTRHVSIASAKNEFLEDPLEGV